MTKNQIALSTGYYERYINLVPEFDLNLAFEHASNQLLNLDLDLYRKIGHKIYQDNKWTIPDILQHLIDTERIMTYRALHYSRNDKTILAGYDEDQYALEANAKLRSIDELMEEYIMVRKASELLFKSFDVDMMLRLGTANSQELSPLALGFVILGHQYHHLAVIEERYHPLYY